jgi:hypothetical protein
MYQRPIVHLGPPTCRQYKGQTAQIIKYPASDQAAFFFVFWLPTREKARKNTGTSTAATAKESLTYAHTASLNLPTCDSSLVSLTLRAPEAGDFMESLEQL